MTCTCGCCEGTHPVTPASVANPPGLDALAYRVGTHGKFLETMLARLTTHELPGEPAGRRPLQQLTARTTDDYSIALLDAWATVGDVLSFYQERIANEGFRRTASERRSLVELGRLIGYELRPAVSSTAFLAFTIADDPTSAQGVPIPVGTRAQSLPPAGGLPASFETAEEIRARPDWNTLDVRVEQPQRVDLIRATFMPSVVLEGAVATLAPGDLLLFDFGDRPGEQAVRRVTGAKIVTAERAPPAPPRPPRTVVALALPLRERWECLMTVGTLLVTTGPVAGAPADLVDGLREVNALAAKVLAGTETAKNLTTLMAKLRDVALRELPAPTDDEYPWVLELIDLMTEAPPPDDPAAAPLVPRTEDPVRAALSALSTPLTQSPATPPASAAVFRRDTRALFGAGSDVAVQLLSVLRPQLAGTLRAALSHAAVSEPGPLKGVYGLSKRAQPFGANAPLKTKHDGNVITGTEEWLLDPGPHTDTVAALDGRYPDVAAESWIVIEQIVPPTMEAGHAHVDPVEDTTLTARRVRSVGTRGVAAYNLSGSVTMVDLGRDWHPSPPDGKPTLQLVRDITFHLAAVPLTLAPEPITEDVYGATIALDGVAADLLSGRRLIVTGERTDIHGVEGIRDGELVMLGAAVQRVDQTLPGDTIHTELQLASPLSYRYRRSTVKVWGNVARATHGETHAEVLGAGDPSKPLQTFKLSLAPLTNLPAANARGADDTLAVRVDGVLWHETDDLMGAAPGARLYLARTDDDGATRTVFGGAARLPSGPDNVRATYRVGSGRGGNVDAEKITQLLTRPLGVRDVINPLPATGGADREDVGAARRSLPLGVMALDRVVSVRDYEDFARARAGIGKASATRISDGHSQFLHLTVAGTDDGPLDESSDLITALGAAVRTLGDPNLPLVVAVRRLRLVVLEAGVRVLPDYEWQEVERRLRSALLDALGFGRRELGEPVVKSKVVAAAQRVPGVAAVNVSSLRLADGDPAAPAAPNHLHVEGAHLNADGSIDPAEIAVVSARVPDTLILHEGLT